jgi:Ni/Co efflux regulator RcnB
LAKSFSAALLPHYPSPTLKAIAAAELKRERERERERERKKERERERKRERKRERERERKRERKKERERGRQCYGQLNVFGRLLLLQHVRTAGEAMCNSGHEKTFHLIFRRRQMLLL